MTPSAAALLPSPPHPATPRWLVDELEARVLDGALAGGMQLPSERELASAVGLGRPAVREAIGRLVERGLVEVHPGRGAYVRTVSPADAGRPLTRLYRRQDVTARALVESRSMLEGEAVALAAVRATERDLTELRELVTTCENTRDVLERAEVDLAFHEGVVAAARNPVIATMFGSIRSLARQQMVRSLGDPDVTREGVPHHRDLFEALVRRDADAARAAAVGHMAVALDWYGADLDVPISELTSRHPPGRSRGDRRSDG